MAKHLGLLCFEWSFQKMLVMYSWQYALSWYFDDLIDSCKLCNYLFYTLYEFMHWFSFFHFHRMKFVDHVLFFCCVLNFKEILQCLQASFRIYSINDVRDYFVFQRHDKNCECLVFWVLVVARFYFAIGLIWTVLVVGRTTSQRFSQLNKHIIFTF